MKSGPMCVQVLGKCPWCDGDGVSGSEIATVAAQTVYYAFLFI